MRENSININLWHLLNPYELMRILLYKSNIRCQKVISLYMNHIPTGPKSWIIRKLMDYLRTCWPVDLWWIIDRVLFSLTYLYSYLLYCFYLNISLLLFRYICTYYLVLLITISYYFILSILVYLYILLSCTFTYLSFH